MPCEHVLLGCGKCTKERDELRVKLAEAEAEIERLRVAYDQEDALTDDLFSQLAAMTKARDEACDMADDYQLGVTRSEYGWSTSERVARIAELRKVGK